jgi:5-methylcytosine-specific restriction enzyme A
MGHEEHVIQSLKKIGKVDWINKYFDLVKKLLTELKIDGNDPRLCLSCTQAGVMPLVMGQRYILMPLKKGSIRCIVPSAFKITRQEGKDNGWFFSPNTTRDAKWIELPFDQESKLPSKIYHAILSSSQSILSRSKKSSHRKNHSSFLYDIIMNPSIRADVSELLSQDDFELESIDKLVYDYPNKRSFLLTWNPNAWNWDNFDDHIREVQQQGATQMSWSCGNSKSIQIGDPVFLMKVGVETPGILGSGIALSTPYRGEHFSDPSREANYIKVRFDILLDVKGEDPPMSLDLLKSNFPDQKWTPQASGISIKTKYVPALNALWFEHLINNEFKVHPLIGKPDPERLMLEGGEYSVTQTRYERDPKTRNKSLAIHGYQCYICKFDFEKKYGELGKGFIHVHHITPLAERGKSSPTDPEKDLIPVCPNCHAMLHRTKEVMAPDTLKEIIRINS